MNTKPNHIICANPACHVEVHRKDAFLRSVSLKQLGFCSPACVDVFDRLDKAARSVPVQRRVSEVGGRMSQ